MARRKTEWTPVLVRLRPATLAALDAWGGASTRVDKIHRLIASGLELEAQREQCRSPDEKGDSDDRGEDNSPGRDQP